jgi:hypothetical protein
LRSINALSKRGYTKTLSLESYRPCKDYSIIMYVEILRVTPKSA